MVDELGGAGGVGLANVAATGPSAVAIGACTTDAGGKAAASGWRAAAVAFGEAAVPQATNIAAARKSIPILAFVT